MGSDLICQPIGSYVPTMVSRDMTMADDEIRTSFQITWITSAIIPRRYPLAYLEQTTQGNYEKQACHRYDLSS